MESIRDLCRRLRQDGYRDDGAGHVGIYDPKAGVWRWHAWDGELCKYRPTGTTDTPEGATYRQLAGAPDA